MTSDILLATATILFRLMLIGIKTEVSGHCTACSHFQCWLRHSWRSTPHYAVLLLLRLFRAAAHVLTARRSRNISPPNIIRSW